MTYLTKNLAFFGSLDGMRASCAEKMCAEKSLPSQALPRQLPQRGSQAVKFVAEVLSVMRKFPAVLLALPLGELSPQVTERAYAVALSAKGVKCNKKLSRRAAASAGSRSGSCRLPLRPLPVKMQCRSVRRRSGIVLLKIIFPLIMAKAHAAAIENRPARSANAYRASTRSNRSFAASTASLLPKATRTPPDSTSDRAAACALSRAASTLHSALRSAARISSVMPQKYR